GIVRCGAFDGKNDLGWHSETTPAGIVGLVKKGIFTGLYKTHHKGKMVASAFRGEDPEEAAYVDRNPMWELYGLTYVNDIRFIASHDNQVAINNALAVDLTGQIASESLGPGVYAGPGGQPEFAIGAVLSKGGRSITVLPSTARNGAISRIVPVLRPGTAVTVPRHFADCIVTEYGVAHLLGKSQRERAEELIAIARPDFRAELRSEAQKLYYP
ncbi:MAG: 4-hydroxybutyrate CoA transferase, partial [Chloroflexi bacterium]|nr:4-hydroxybutyrate CoA transferase [Chloroflexota bacterium]